MKPPLNRYKVYSYLGDDCLGSAVFHTLEVAGTFVEGQKSLGRADGFFIVQFCSIHRRWFAIGAQCPDGETCLHAYDNLRDSLINLREWVIQTLDELEDDAFTVGAARDDLRRLENPSDSVLSNFLTALRVVAELDSDDDLELSYDEALDGDEFNPFGTALER